MSDLQEVVRREQSVSSLRPAPENSQVIGPSPTFPQITRPRGNTSCSSRVPVGYFDQEGVNQLRRTITNLSESPRGRETALASSHTPSVPPPAPFAFLKTLSTTIIM